MKLTDRSTKKAKINVSVKFKIMPELFLRKWIKYSFPAVNKS